VACPQGSISPVIHQRERAKNEKVMAAEVANRGVLLYRWLYGRWTLLFLITVFVHGEIELP